MTARLDRLGPAREVAPVAAVIGRDFSYSLLRTIAGMDDTPLQATLDRLADADILLVQGIPPDADYRFKHALIQDAAYENLLKSRAVARLCIAARARFCAISLLEAEGAEEAGSQSYVPPEEKDDRALKEALDLLRGTITDAAFPPNPKGAVR